MTEPNDSRSQFEKYLAKSARGADWDTWQAVWDVLQAKVKILETQLVQSKINDELQMQRAIKAESETESQRALNYELHDYHDRAMIEIAKKLGYAVVFASSVCL